MAKEQDDPPSGNGTAAAVVAAGVTAVVGWLCFHFGTQGLLPTEPALALALGIGAVAGVLAAFAVTGWLRRPRRVAEPEPELEPEPEEVEEPDPHDVDVVELVREIVAEQQPRFTDAGTILQAMVSGRIRVDAGRRRITAEVMHLLDDAYHATKRLDPGEVLIGVARKTVAEDPVARVTITDNRVGATAMLTLPLMPSAEDAEKVGA